MYRLFLKISARYLLKNKLYSFINIFGLAIGVASFVLIMLYVNYERSYDTFKGSENVYRVFMDYLEGEEWVPGDANAYIVSGPTLQEKFPEILDFVRLRRVKEVVLMRDEAVFDHNIGALADPSFFDIFDRTLEKGDLESALSEPYSIVLSATLSKKIFGAEDPIGKTIKIAYDPNSTFKITGVLSSDTPKSHLKNDFLISFKTFYSWQVFERDWKYTWNQNEYYTYLKLDKNTDIVALNKKVMDFKPKGLGKERHHLEAIEDIHLYSNKPYEAETNGSGNGIRLLSVIAIITLLLSWMNYINLSTSKSLERAKEIGVRKVVGAKKPQLIVQSLIESAMLNCLAMVFGIALVIILLPAFNQFIGLKLQLDSTVLKGLLPYFGFMLAGVALSSFYPALVLSNYKSVTVLKGRLGTSSKGLTLRRGLIIGQFLATITLLAGTIMANKQIDFLQNRPIGADLNHLVAMRGQVIQNERDSLFTKDFETLIENITKVPFVEGAVATGTYPGDDFANLNSNIGIVFPDGRSDDKRIWYNYAVQPAYFDIMNMEFAAGQGFYPTATGRSNNIVINERMARFMGVTDMQSIIGKTMKFWDDSFMISGVVKDYHHFGLKTPMEPMIITHNRSWRNIIIVKLDDKATSISGASRAIDELDKMWHQSFPTSTFNYTFLDENFQKQYIEDRRFAKAFQIFTILAILIASMGLFGLTSYTVVQRKKEIGIRKVNGATVFQIVTLLNKDFVKWVGIAFLGAIPISWYAMNRWLDGFAYSTEISWWIFIIAGGLALFIAFLTVSWQSLKAAVANPVDALRDE